MFCSGDLDRNQVVESFPVGRRLAFDSVRGRLWVVCRRCERWNLTPIEERWEAIEECERWFRETRTRMSTENVGIARLAEGLELVRIGAPERPEFAAWRYGDQFGRRRRKSMLMGAAWLGVGGTVLMAGVVTGAVSAVALSQSSNLISLWNHQRTVARLRLPDGTKASMTGIHLQRSQFLQPQSPGEGWGLALEHRKGTETFTGPEAARVAGRLMTRVNREGGRGSTVRTAAKKLEDARHPDAFLEDFIRSHGAPSESQSQPQIDWFGRKRKNPHGALLTRQIPGAIAKLDKPARLALEMAIHEEQERRALEGELRILEQAWREAEEIAAIADDLLLPEGTEEFLERHRALDPNVPSAWPVVEPNDSRRSGP